MEETKNVVRVEKGQVRNLGSSDCVPRNMTCRTFLLASFPSVRPICHKEERTVSSSSVLNIRKDFGRQTD